MSSDRTLPATPRRREQAQRRGLLPTSDGVAWMASTIVLTACLPMWLTSMTTIVSDHLLNLPGDLADPTLPLGPIAARLAWQLVWPTLLVLTAATTAGLGVRMLADRPRLVPGRLAAWERLSPANGIRRMASRETARQLLTGLLATVVLGLAMWWSFDDLVASLRDRSLSPVDTAQGSLWLGWHGLWGLLAAASLVAAVQQFLRWRASERRLRMTAEELREEQRLLEADPRIRLPTRDAPDEARPAVNQQPAHS